MDALEQAGDRDEHSEIAGKAGRGAELTISKDFDLWTNPILQADGSLRPVAFANHLTSSMVVTNANGTFNWSMNPSVRPVPPYQADGVHGDHAGFIREAWTLTCARRDGTVLQTVSVLVDLGEREAVDLERCRKGL